MKKALLIGINYVGSVNELNGCINDVNNMKAALISLYRFQEANIIVLADSPNQTADKLPTKANILNNIAKFVQNLYVGDSLVFHYSGHGMQIPDENNDEITHLDDVIIPVDFDKNGVIVDDDIFLGLIQKIPKNVKLNAFFDCCHSGSVTDLEWNFKYMGNPPPTTTVAKVEWNDYFKLWLENNNAANGNIYMFSGSYDEDLSADAYINSTYQGAFTFCLLEILAKKVKNTKYRDLLKQINADLSDKGYVQRSQFSCSAIKQFDDVFTL